MSFDANRIAEARARCEAATAGPWERWAAHASVFAGPLQCNLAAHAQGGRGRLCEFDPGNYDQHGEAGAIMQARADAEFAANARADLPDALDEIDDLRRQLADARKALADKQQTYSDRIKDLEAENERLQGELIQERKKSSRLQDFVGKLSRLATARVTELGGRIDQIMRQAVRLPPGGIAEFHRLTTEQANAIGLACIDAKADTEIEVLRLEREAAKDKP